MEDKVNSKVIWKNMQQVWSTGDVKAAHAILTTLIEGKATTDSNTWRLWGDTAAALKDLRLAACAYRQARLFLPSNQPKYRWLNRYLYASLQTGVATSKIWDEYNTAPIPSENVEDKLIGLALEADLHYRMGDIPQAAVVGKDMLDQWLDASSTAFEFLEQVQDRLWLMLARLAEESGNASVANHFLFRIENLNLVGTELQPTINLLNVLLGRQLATDIYNEAAIQRIIHRLENVLSVDFSTIHPPIPEDLIKSLHQTLVALQIGANKLTVLEEAIEFRQTNVLAWHLYIEESNQRGKPVEPILAARANMWLTLNLHKESISRFLARPPKETDSNFAFVALGGGGHVGGSSYLLDINGTKLLLDAGLDIGTSPISCYRRFKSSLTQSGIVNNLAELDAVLISHAHLDHIGILPALYTDPDLPHIKISSGVQSQIPFYASNATREIARVMLEDAGRLAMDTTENPLYTLNDVAEAVDALKPPKDGRLHLFHNLGQVELLESGHILGARMVLLEKNDFSVLYTGDFNTRSQITLPASASLQGLRPDVLIMESTYGYNADEWTLPRSWQEQAFIYLLDKVLRRGGVVLLPAFAVGRSQEVLGVVAKHTCYNHDLSYSIYLDGLSRTITKCYDKYDRQLPKRYQEFRAKISHRLVSVPDDTDRDTLIQEQVLGRPNVIIASSGMLKEGSASYQYAEHIAGDPKNAIFYTGYLADDSEAAVFLGNETDNLYDNGINVRCEQRRFHFSAHAPKEDLLQFVLDVQPRAVILVHGDASKRTQVTNNLYALLKQLENDSFHVFLGQEGHRVEYCKRRFYQQ